MENKKEINYSEPMVVQIENTSENIENVVLFGSNRYSKKKNYGNKKCIVITEINGRNDYGALLEELKTSDYGGVKTRITDFMNIHKGYFTKCIYSNFGSVRTYIDMNVYIMMDPYQYQSNIVDTYGANNTFFNIDANTHYKFKLKGKSKIILTIYATQVRLSGKNVAPVIIQASNEDIEKLTNKNK